MSKPESDKVEELEHGSIADQGNQLKQSKEGVILHPQPSDDPNDPLNWSELKKHLALISVCWLAFFSYVSVTALVPATVELGAEFNVSKNTAVYLGNAPVAMFGVGPFLWCPLSHVIGRRSVLLTSNIVCLAGVLIVGGSISYGSCIAGRMIAALGGSAFWGLGPSIASDMFFRHDRGKKIGITSVFIVTAPYFGSIIGGCIISDAALGWRWTQWLSGILIGVGLIIQLFLLPETIYVRHDGGEVDTSDQTKSKFKLFRLIGIHKPINSTGNSLLKNAYLPFKQFSLIYIFIPCFWFGVCYMSHVGITALLPLIYEEPPYYFDARGVGLGGGVSGLIGALVGEAVAGPYVDYIARKAENSNSGYSPEKRLVATIGGLVTCPVGLLVFGLCIQFTNSWVVPLIGQSIYIFGIEILTTTLQTYILESDPAHGVESTLVFNFSRNLMSFCTPFYITKFIELAKTGWAFGTMALIIVFFFPLMIFLMLKGEKLRSKNRNDI
jgi:MFS family permease